MGLFFSGGGEAPRKEMSEGSFFLFFFTFLSFSREEGHDGM